MFRLVLVFVALCCATTIVSASTFGENCEHHFEHFKRKHLKQYETREEEGSRRNLFCHNMRKNDERNRGSKKGDVFGITKFSDWTEEEFSVLLGRKKTTELSEKQKSQVRKPTGNLHGALKAKGVSDDTNTVDWVEAGYVTPVKNQGQCGSCWAHSATEQIESEFMLKGNSMWEFSVQQVNSCVKKCLGCGGGDTPAAYDYLMSLTADKVGLGSSAWAPYVESMTETCLGKRCTESCDDLGIDVLKTKAHLTGYYVQVDSFDYATPPCDSGACDAQNMTTLAANVKSHGPASICVNAASWSNYVSGVMTVDQCGGFSATDLDHCVQLTGYGVDSDGTPYWNVRNSWSTDWGIDGYIRLEMSDTANPCGMANEATQVNVVLPQQELKEL